MLGLLLLIALLNGDFSDGLKHWQADAGWSAKRGAAVLNLDNRAGAGTQGTNLCSDPVLAHAGQLRGGATVKTNVGGYVFVGVKWYDKRGNVLWTEMLTSGESKEGHNVRLTFVTDKPRNAAHVSFCFFGGAYAGETFTARVDNAELK